MKAEQKDYKSRVWTMGKQKSAILKVMVLRRTSPIQTEKDLIKFILDRWGKGRYHLIRPRGRRGFQTFGYFIIEDERWIRTKGELWHWLKPSRANQFHEIYKDDKNAINNKDDVNKEVEIGIFNRPILEE